VLRVRSLSLKTSHLLGNANYLDAIYIIGMIIATMEPLANASIPIRHPVCLHAMSELGDSAVAGAPGTVGASRSLGDRVVPAP
jgi:hypothetical protein